MHLVQPTADIKNFYLPRQVKESPSSWPLLLWNSLFHSESLEFGNSFWNDKCCNFQVLLVGGDKIIFLLVSMHIFQLSKLHLSYLNLKHRSQKYKYGFWQYSNSSESQKKKKKKKLPEGLVLPFSPLPQKTCSCTFFRADVNQMYRREAPDLMCNTLLDLRFYISPAHSLFQDVNSRQTQLHQAVSTLTLDWLLKHILFCLCNLTLCRGQSSSYY